MTAPKENPPAWKYWWPLSIWKVVAIFFVTNLVMQLAAAALREGLGLTWMAPNGVAAGAGVVGFFIIWKLAQKARLKTNGKNT